MCDYKYIEHTADIGIEVSANSIDKLFKISALAWMETIIGKVKLENVLTKNIELEGISHEDLLVVFLSELNYIFLVKKEVYQPLSISIWKEGQLYKLKAELYGEIIDYKKYTVNEEIKAVTYHQIKISQEGKNFNTKIIFDI